MRKGLIWINSNCEGRFSANDEATVTTQAYVTSTADIFLFSCRSQEFPNTDTKGRSRWPRGLRCGSAADRLLVLRVRLPPGTWMSLFYECCMLSGRYLCVRLITRPEESYRAWCVCVCDREASIMRRPWPTGCCCTMKRKFLTVC